MDIIPASFQNDESSLIENTNETLGVLEAARRAGVTQSAILRWIRNGYLAATPSSNGWQIPAHLLDDAARAADEARGTGSVPRRTTPTLEPAPVPIRRSMELRAVETPAKLDAIGESIVSPLAELIRDQIDVVHDQAEVIGWLQAERARLASELQELKSKEPGSTAWSGTHAISATASMPADHNLYDEVVSLLWKDSSNASRVEENAFQPSRRANDFAASTNASSEATLEPFSWDFDDWFADAPDEGAAGSDHELSQDENEISPLKLEDYADPSWFFARNDLQDFGEQCSEDAHGAPALKPIVPREVGAATASIESEEERHLREMIDETERKIAQLWQNEEQLRSLQPAEHSVESDEQVATAGRESIWQRIWPLRR